MKWLPVFLGVLVFFRGPPLIAQDGNTADWDIDSLFDEPPDTSEEEAPEEQLTVSNLVKQRGFFFDASYGFHASIAPGWTEAPWFPNVNREFSFLPGVKMNAAIGLDIQISEVFRVKNTFSFEIPNFKFTLGDFFFDYSLYNTVFVRGGKYGLSWGISPNYGFTNLLARVPPGSSGGEPYTLKADIPIGIGGIQVLAMTRANLLGGVMPTRRDMGIGGKYNLALRWVDIDCGAFYQSGMPLRGFLSMKTTIGSTELYHEWMAALEVKNPANVSGAANIGVARDFFDNKLTFNGELFFNAEENALWYRPETTLREEGTVAFIVGPSLAMNLVYRIGGRGNPRVFTQVLYAPLENAAQFIPGFALSPWPHVEFYWALPMSLGGRDSYYYRNTLDAKNRPFSLIFLVSLTGGLQYGHYF